MYIYIYIYILCMYNIYNIYVCMYVFMYDILDNMNNLPCNCTTSPFTDPNHRHIVTGDIRIVQNNKLRKLLCKGPKYREPVSINFSNCKTEIKNSLTKFSSDWCNNKGVPVKCFTQWMSIVMGKVNKKIKELKN